MPYRISPIHILAARNRVQDIKLALKKNHPFTATAEGLTILSIALENNNIELI